MITSPWFFSMRHGLDTCHARQHDLRELAVRALLVQRAGYISPTALGAVVCLATMCHITPLASDLLGPGWPLVICDNSTLVGIWFLCELNSETHMGESKGKKHIE